MNIFVVHQNPSVAATSLCDKHVVKMIVESVQMLVNPYILQGLALDSKTASGTSYKLSHVNHPCSKWCRESAANYTWLILHAVGLCQEYSRRYGKTHRCAATIAELAGRQTQLVFETTGLTPFAMAMPDECKIGDAVASYREYYRKEKAYMAKWNKRPESKPEWFC